MKAFDTDGALDLVAAKDAGACAVGLYLGGNLTNAALRQAATLDMGVWSFWEDLPTNPNGGAPQGVTDAGRAVALADAVAQPLEAPIYMPNDQAVTNWVATLDYFKAVANGIKGAGRVPGFYGQAAVWKEVQPYGYAYFCKAPDGTTDTSGANIVQGVSPSSAIGGVPVDVDEILTADFGGWNATGLWPQGGLMTIHNVSVTAGTDGQGSTGVSLAFDKIASWSVVGGVGPQHVTVECKAHGAMTVATIKGAAPSETVTVRLLALP